MTDGELIGMAAKIADGVAIVRPGGEDVDDVVEVSGEEGPTSVDAQKMIDDAEADGQPLLGSGPSSDLVHDDLRVDVSDRLGVETTLTRERDVAWRKMLAVSSISTMKVLCPPARSS
jgi:hypothetical protein